MTENSNGARVSVIIPTMASVERQDSLRRAISSVRSSSALPVRIIAVVNGSRFDVGICEWLRQQPDVQFLQLPEPSAPNAVLQGRKMVQTEFFSALDDDDEYLPESTDHKLVRLDFDPAADFIVTNYYQNDNNNIVLRYEEIDLVKVPKEPLYSLMKFNWLSSGNALFRSQSVPIKFFENYHPYAEWTFIAFKLASSNKKVIVLNDATFRCNVTQSSLSQSESYVHSYVPLFQKMLNISPSNKITVLIKGKIGAAYHDASVLALKNKKKRIAWKYHLMSLAQPGGIRYLSYTRHLFSKP